MHNRPALTPLQDDCPSQIGKHLHQLALEYLKIVEDLRLDERAMRELLYIERVVDELFADITPAEVQSNRLSFGVLKNLVTQFGPKRAIH